MRPSLHEVLNDRFLTRQHLWPYSGQAISEGQAPFASTLMHIKSILLKLVVFFLWQLNFVFTVFFCVDVNSFKLAVLSSY